MRRNGLAAALVVAVALLASACTDNKAPRGSGTASSAVNSFAPPSSESPSDTALARSLARTFADGLQQSAPTRITPRQADCLVDQVVAHLNVQVLSNIASGQPDPRTLPEPVRTAFVDAFERCLPPDVVAALQDRFHS
ncbi:MAG TPA: hypothetical protein VGJ03_00860 [Acidimicrobiales bacterium]